MGGEGSGRLPGPETIAKRMEGNTGREVITQWLPGIGAVKPEALRSSPVDITGGGGGHTIQEEGSDLTARTYLNFSGNAVTAYDDGTATIVSIDASGAETDPIYLSLSGNHAAAVHTHALVAGATDVTSTAAELNILDGATLTVTELNYVDGVTSAIQTQIDGKSPTAGNASLVTVGTIATGVWSGTALVAGKVPAHDDLTGFVANEHIDWTSTSSNLFTTGSLSGNSGIIGTLSGNAIRTLEDHSTSGNSAVVGIITHTSATPPTASTFPIGTVYIRYTA